MKLLIAVFMLALATLQPVYAGETYDITMKAGADYRATHVWSSKSGAAINLTGTAYQAQFRSAPYPAGVLFATYSTTVTNAAAGQIRMSLSRRQTTTLSGKSGVWDIKQTGADGSISYRYGGTVRVIPTVTAP